MTYPQFPQAPPMAPPPPVAQPWGQVPGYPQMPQAPGYGYPPQQYAAPPQQSPPAQGSLSDYYSQPSSGGGAGLKFEQPGQSYVGMVVRAITPGDIQQQVDPQGRLLTFRDGRPKFVMLVPLAVQPTQQYPEGRAVWY